MTSISDTPIFNPVIYRNDVYRLLTLILADEQIAMDEDFRRLSEESFDAELNTLLVLVAVTTRRLLENYGSKLTKKICGEFWQNYPDEKK